MPFCHFSVCIHLTHRPPTPCISSLSLPMTWKRISTCLGSLTTEGCTDPSAQGTAGPVQHSDPWRTKLRLIKDRTHVSFCEVNSRLCPRRECVTFFFCLYGGDPSLPLRSDVTVCLFVFFFGLLLRLRGDGQQSVDFLALIRSIERVGLGLSLSAQTPSHEKKLNFRHIPFLHKQAQL